ncbi:hypothetical protein GQ55_9G362100 [Panicum hallii var. hallii]|uniref:Uncharacterized protein n=1 Tax=Panicum hallii var. hallii TaxID=1504633 RepID=A0A2T7C8T5_9POAL|nr:hypothetical protein GQ55_9G362000 [Panicum hallii var. hallii]PUZ39746.1 hypothetical protein GQ55_9G362100 [Panicum hallii var. hallii]
MQYRGPPKKTKKIIEPSCESSIVPVGLTPKTMNFPPTSGSGLNQLELLPAREKTLPPATSKPREKKAKGKAKAARKKLKKVSVPHDSPAMSTRSKTPQQDSPTSRTKGKRKLPLTDLN